MIEKILLVQCDNGSSLQRSNTENVKVLTKSTGNFYICTNTAFNLF